MDCNEEHTGSKLSVTDAAIMTYFSMSSRNFLAKDLGTTTVPSIAHCRQHAAIVLALREHSHDRHACPSVALGTETTGRPWTALAVSRSL